MALEKKERNRRIKLGILALAIMLIAYALAKISNDTSGDWFKLSLMTIGLIGWTEGCVTLTDIYGKKM